MKDALLNLWCEMWEAVWRGVLVAITMYVAINVLFAIFFKKTPARLQKDREAVQMAQMFPNPINEFAGLEDE